MMGKPDRSGGHFKTALTLDNGMTVVLSTLERLSIDWHRALVGLFCLHQVDPNAAHRLESYALSDVMTTNDVVDYNKWRDDPKSRCTFAKSVRIGLVKYGVPVEKQTYLPAYREPVQRNSQLALELSK